MTEADWLSCSNPKPMLMFLSARATDRKMRLLACAGCRTPIIDDGQPVDLAGPEYPGRALRVT